jgi:hypothetical protein
MSTENKEQELEIGSGLELMVEAGAMTMEEAREQVSKSQSEKIEDVVLDTDTTDPDPIKETEVEETVLDAPKPYYEKHGFTSEEEADAFFANYSKIAEKEKALSEKEQYINYIESPFYDEDDIKVNQFKKETGLKGRVGTDVAMEVLFTDAATIKDNPVLAKAIASVIDNPEKLKSFSLSAIQGKIQRDAERLGVDFDRKDSDEYKDFMIDAFDSINKIEKYREKYGKTEDVFQSIKTNREKQSELTTKQLESLKSNVSNIGLTQLTHKFGDQEVVWDAPKNPLEGIPNDILVQMASSYDVSTESGKKALREELNTYLTVTKALNGDLAKTAYEKGVKDTKEAAEKKALQVKLNGGAVHRGGKAEDTAGISDTQQEINDAYGIK